MPPGGLEAPPRGRDPWAAHGYDGRPRDEAAGGARGAVARLACCCTERLVWPHQATWPVGADLLFERVRSQRYMALTCVLNLYEWFHDYLTETRADLGSRTWGVYQLQPLYYWDCAGRTGLEDFSLWSGLPCGATPFSGPWYELLLWIFPLLLVNSGLNFINNPFRSRWWSLAALAQIVMSLARYIVLLTSVDFRIRVEPGRGTYSALEVWRKIILVSGIVGPLVAWLGVLGLLIRMMEHKAAFMEAWHEGAMHYTKRLLSRRDAGLQRPDLPGRYQELAAQLRGACRPEDLPACTLAALGAEEERRRLEEEAVEQAQTPPPPRTRRRLPEWLGGRSISKDSSDDAVRRSLSGRSGDPGRRRARETQHRLPGLVYVASLLSIVVVVLFSNVAFVGVLQLHEYCAEYTAKARAWADQAVDAADQVSAAAQQLQQMTSFVKDQHELLQQTRQHLLDLHLALDPLQLRLQSVDEDAAAAVGRAAALARAAVGLLPVNASLPSVVEVPFASTLAQLAFDAGVLSRLSSVALDASTHVRRLRNWVHSSCTVVMEMAWSAGMASFFAGLLSLLAVLVLVLWTCHQWRLMRHSVAVGEVKGCPRWQPNVFHPVRAPMLPGLMASSSLFAFFWLFFLTFMVIQVFWWLKLTMDWEMCKRLTLNTGLLLTFRVVVLDEWLGRRVLSNRGFVVRWCGFSWYICFALPFHLITSIAMAFSRFMMLMGMVMIYVVRLDTTLLPPSLQRFDPGYVSFMASVLLAHRHQNRVWQGFLHAFLFAKSSPSQPKGRSWTEALSQKQPRCRPDQVCKHVEREHSSGSRPQTPETCAARKARMQWSLLRTLAFNPQLALERRRYDGARTASPSAAQHFGAALTAAALTFGGPGSEEADAEEAAPGHTGWHAEGLRGESLAPEDVTLSVPGDPGDPLRADEELPAAGTASSRRPSRAPSSAYSAGPRAVAPPPPPMRQHGRCLWVWSLIPGL